MLGFLWQAAKGNRLQPWRSRYLLWRIETYWGWHADKVTPRQFRSFLWEHRMELWRFLCWAARMRQKCPES
jgi:hypothetical protein